MLRVAVDQDELKLLLNALCWNYKAQDHEMLSKVRIFETLQKGDGSDLSWVRYYSGNFTRHPITNYQKRES